MRPRIASGRGPGFAACLLPLAAIVLAAAPAGAAGDGRVGLELNKLEPRDKACRAYIVLSNGTTSAFETLKLDLVMFDGEGVVARRIAVEGAPLAAGKTSLKVFDMDGTSCDGIGRVLLNDVMACRDASGERDDCADLITPSSRVAEPFIK